MEIFRRQNLHKEVELAIIEEDSEEIIASDRPFLQINQQVGLYKDSWQVEE